MKEKEQPIIRGFFSAPENQRHAYIDNHFHSQLFGSFLAQKGFEKIYHMQLCDDEKAALVSHLMTVFSSHSEEIKNVYEFIKSFFPIADNYRRQIRTLIGNNFDSLSQFYYYLGRFVNNDPLIIEEAKQIMICFASDTLPNDLVKIQHSLSIDLPINIQKASVFEKIYYLAINLGALREKYNAICFGREIIESLTCDQKPTLVLKLKDPLFEYGVQFGFAFHQLICSNKKEDFPDTLQQYYKCYLCQYCVINHVDDSIKETVISLLKRQYNSMYLTDALFYYTNDMPSYLLSVISYLYSNILLLIYCTKQTMSFIPYKTVRKEMLWGAVIPEADFDLLINQINESKAFQRWIQSNKEGFIIGRWQFDCSFAIPEMVNRLVLDSRADSRLGRLSGSFGKDAFEPIVRGMTEKYGWKTITHPVRLKANGTITTDVDLLAYKAGVVLVGQVKVANCGITTFDIWKTKQVVDKAILQSIKAQKAFDNDRQLLFSILKKEKIISSKKEIKTMLPIVISRSSYFIGMGGLEKVSVMCVEMFRQILAFLNNCNDMVEIANVFRKPLKYYDLNVDNSITISRIDQEDYCISYEEILSTEE